MHKHAIDNKNWECQTQQPTRNDARRYGTPWKSGTEYNINWQSELLLLDNSHSNITEGPIP